MRDNGKTDGGNTVAAAAVPGRRDFLVGAIGAGAAALALGATLGEARAQDAPKMTPAREMAPTPLQIEVAKRAASCLAAGELCSAHCARELGAGNKAMGNCNQKVHDMLAACRAMISLASAASPLAKAMAAVCADACKACGDACLEHKAHWAHNMHLECKSCYEECQACEKACRDLVKA